MPTRTVHCTDGPQWLRDHALGEGHAMLTSLPDSSEHKRLAFAEWQRWFTTTAELVARATPERCAAIFYQTDVKRGGTWVDKAHLVQRGAEAAGAHTLWHKIVCRAPAGTTTFGRPGYAHLLCVSRLLVDDIERATPDVLPRLGTMTWPRAMGLEAAHAAVLWLRDHAGARCIVDPFCGVGTALAVANHHGLDAIGIERAPGRAAKARTLTL
ncbi:MAG TPA: SAM-dependent methyltransferase [Planctomycetota bacterium]|nr:SAM-dependent methyltransferase [Planctomycetota bacterium]